MNFKKTSFAKKKSGFTAKKNGQSFEAIFAYRCHLDGLSVKKIPDGCKRLPGGKTIPVKTPFDFIVVSDSRVLFIDTKSSESSVFNYSQIDQAQVKHLSDLKASCSLCGYVINLSGEVYFFDVKILSSCPPNTSLSKENGIFLGNMPNFSLKALL